MKVKDLIAELQQRDPNALVLIPDGYDSSEVFKEVIECKEFRVAPEGMYFVYCRIDKQAPDHRGSLSAVSLYTEDESDWP